MTDEVTQDDVEAAQNALHAMRGYAVKIYPQHPLARAFAHHRISHQGRTSTAKDGLTGDVAELARQLNNESCGFGIGHAYLMQKAAAKLTELAAEVERVRTAKG